MHSSPSGYSQGMGQGIAIRRPGVQRHDVRCLTRLTMPGADQLLELNEISTFAAFAFEVAGVNFRGKSPAKQFRGQRGRPAARRLLWRAH
jgi:hypothetical protein